MTRRGGWIWLLLGVVLGGCRGAGPPRPPLQLPVAWQVGDRLALWVVSERFDLRGKERVPGGRGTSPVEVEVVSHAGDAYMLHWTYGTVTLEGGPALPEPTATFVRRLSTSLDGKRLVIAVEPKVGRTTVTNIDEVTAWYRQVFADMHRILLAGGMPPGDAERLMATVAAYGRPEAVAAWSLQLPRLFLRFVGAQLTPGEVVEYDDRVALEVGAPPVPTRGRYVFEAVDGATHEARIVWRQRLDEKVMRERAFETMAVAAKRMGRPEPRRSDVPRLALEEEGQWVMDTTTGWPVAVTFSRTSRSRDAGWADTTSLTVQRRPSAQ